MQTEVRYADLMNADVIKYMPTERDLRNQMAYATKVAIAEGLAGAVRIHFWVRL